MLTVASLAVATLLVTAGRVPNTDDLGLDSVGLRANMRGYIGTNDRLETSAWHLGAGDINQRGAFTHTSYHDQDVLAENLAGAAQRRRAQQYLRHVHRSTTGTRGAVKPRPSAQWKRRVGVFPGRARDEGREPGEGREETVGLIKLLIDETAACSWAPRCWASGRRDHSIHWAGDGQPGHLAHGA